jgi:hypothetical protein
LCEIAARTADRQRVHPGEGETTMTRERWGTFSVIDHVNAAALVPEVLLYDRLVLPVPGDEEDRKRWAIRGWRSEVLDRRLEQLGPLAVKANWGFLERLQAIANWEARLRAVRFDADQVLNEIKEKNPYQMTRMVLADLKQTSLPAGVTDVVSVAAFQSEQEFRTSYHLESPSEDRSTLGFLLGQKLAVPHDEDPERVLDKSINMVTQDDDFQENRRKLHAWQESMLRDKIKPEDAIQEMDQMVTSIIGPFKKQFARFSIDSPSLLPALV